MPPSARFAVVGDPIEHSLSPVLHRAGYVAAGLDLRYDAERVAAGSLASYVAGLGSDWRGLSVTMPLKREALALATTSSPRASLAGAANTLLLDPDHVRADNTDVAGAVAAIIERTDDVGGAATILGGGATAASVGLALIDLGVSALRLLVRDAARAADAVATLRAHPAAPRVEVGSLASDLVAGRVVVSTVPAEAQTPDLVARCAEVPVVFEVRYDPWPTPLAASVGSGRILIGGLDLLVHQAAEQFRLFTGTPAPLEAMRSAGEQALAERSRPRDPGRP